jgi:CheY-like chemotaxis protein
LGGGQHGVASYTAKPSDVDTLAEVFARITQRMSRPIRALLVIENDPAKRQAIIEALQSDEVTLDAVASGGEAMATLQRHPYQGIVLDLDLPDMDGMVLLQEIRRDASLASIPAVIYTARALDPGTEQQLQQLGAALVPAGESSLDRLRQEAAQFLQRVKTGLQDDQPIAQEPASPVARSLEGAKVLVVDDDVRNLFALTGLLESHGMTVFTAENGNDAIARLNDTAGIDIVLMDIMMPDMDGYTTLQQVRRDSRFKDLPIIALTAKAMKGDRAKCLAAGASDYASKPVDSEQLLAQLRNWIRR